MHVPRIPGAAGPGRHRGGFGQLGPRRGAGTNLGASSRELLVPVYG